MKSQKDYQEMGHTELWIFYAFLHREALDRRMEREKREPAYEQGFLDGAEWAREWLKKHGD